MDGYNQWKESLHAILANVVLNQSGWMLVLREDEVFKDKDGNGRFFLQIRFTENDNITGEPNKPQFCRKWYLSPYMTKQEVVRTAYKAFEAAVLHEMQEKFLYCGKMIYNPHQDVDKLLTIADCVDIRSNHV